MSPLTIGVYQLLFSKDKTNRNRLMFSNSYLYERSLIIARNIFMVVQYLFIF